MMNEYRDMFDAAIGTVPPSTVDIDEIVRRSRRTVRIRRGLLGGGSVVAVTALVIGGAAVLTAPRGGVDGATIGVSAASTANPSASATGVAGLQDHVRVAERLSTVLGAAVHGLVPQAVATANGTGTATRPLEFSYVNVPHFGESRYSDPHSSGPVPAQSEFPYVAGADLRDAGGTGSLSVEVWPTSPTTLASCPPGEVPSEETDCQQSTGPHGETVVRTTSTVLGGLRGHSTSVRYRVAVTRTDGTAVVAIANNWGQIVDTEKVADARRTTPPLTMDQLTTLALDPGLVLSP